MSSHSIVSPNLGPKGYGVLKDAAVRVGEQVPLHAEVRRVCTDQLFRKLQQAHMIAHRTKLLMRWSEYRLCPHPCKDIKYKLTPSAIEVDIDRSICGQTKHSIDVSQITDVQLHVPSCAAGCFYNSVFVETRSDAPLRMAVRSSQARQVFETIKNAWEGHQAAVANRRIGAF